MGGGMGSIMMGGGQWEPRLKGMCRALVFDHMDEDSLYKMYRSEKKISQKVCKAPHSPFCDAEAKSKKDKKAAKKAEKLAKKEAAAKAAAEKAAAAKKEADQLSLVNFMEGLAL